MDSTASNFSWGSPLGASVILFLLQGAIYLLVGGLSLFLISESARSGILIVSGRTDTALFGDTPPNIVQADPALARLRLILMHMLGGTIFAMGLLVVAVAWFGLRRGEVWALVTLGVVGLAVLPFWAAALRPYWAAGIRPTLGDLPPFMWVPAAVLLPALITGAVGLR